MVRPSKFLPKPKARKISISLSGSTQAQNAAGEQGETRDVDVTAPESALRRKTNAVGGDDDDRDDDEIAKAPPAVMPTVKAHNKATAKGGSKVSVPIPSVAAVTDDEWGDEVAKDAPGPPATLSTLGSRARTEASSTRVAGDEGQDIDAPIVPGARRKPRATADAVAQRQAANKPAGQPTPEKPAPSNVAADESGAVAVVARKQSKRRPSVSEDGAATGLVPLADETLAVVESSEQRKRTALVEALDHTTVTMRELLYLNPIDNPTKNESKKRERKAKAKELRALKVEIEKLHKSVARERRKTESIDRELATKIEPDSSDTEGEAAKESAKNKRAELHERLEEAREKVEEQLALIDEKERNVARLDQEIETLRPTVYKTAGLRGGNNEYRNAQDDTVPAVQLVMDASGNVVVDRDSLNVTASRSAPNLALRVAEAGVEEKTTYASYANWERAERWTDDETERFFQALSQFGPNFGFIQTVFPSRTRKQLVRKFKAEEKRDKRRVDYALTTRLPMPALSAPTPPAILPTNGDNNEQPEAVQAAASAQPAPAAGKRQAVQKADASDAPAASKRGRGGNPTAAPAAKGKEAPAAKTATARRGRQKAVASEGEGDPTDADAASILLSMAATKNTTRSRKRTASITEADAPPSNQNQNQPPAPKARKTSVSVPADPISGANDHVNQGENETDDDEEIAAKAVSGVPSVKPGVGRRGKVSKFQPKVKAKS